MGSVSKSFWWTSSGPGGGIQEGRWRSEIRGRHVPVDERETLARWRGYSELPNPVQGTEGLRGQCRLAAEDSPANSEMRKTAAHSRLEKSRIGTKFGLRCWKLWEEMRPCDSLALLRWPSREGLTWHTWAIVTVFKTGSGSVCQLQGSSPYYQGFPVESVQRCWKSGELFGGKDGEGGANENSGQVRRTTNSWPRTCTGAKFTYKFLFWIALTL